MTISACPSRVLVPAALALCTASCTASAPPVAASQVPPTLTNSLGMTLVLVPAGEFVMGADEERSATLRALPYCNPELLPRESPPHRVQITKPFYMGRCEVTLGQFRTFCRESGYVIDAEDGKAMTGYGEKGEIIESTAFRP